MYLTTWTIHSLHTQIATFQGSFSRWRIDIFKRQADFLCCPKIPTEPIGIIIIFFKTKSCPVVDEPAIPIF